MITEITREVEQIKILDHVVELKPITKASIQQIQSLGNGGDLNMEDFESILKIGIGEDAFNEVFPTDEDMDLEIMIKAALVIYEKILR